MPAVINRLVEMAPKDRSGTPIEPVIASIDSRDGIQHGVMESVQKLEEKGSLPLVIVVTEKPWSESEDNRFGGRIDPIKRLSQCPRVIITSNSELLDSMKRSEPHSLSKVL